MSIVAVSESARIREPVVLMDGPVIGMSPVALTVRRETEETVIVTPRLVMAETPPPVRWFEHRYERIGDTPAFRHAPDWQP